VDTVWSVLVGVVAKALSVGCGTRYYCGLCRGWVHSVFYGGFHRSLVYVGDCGRFFCSRVSAAERLLL